MYVILFCFFFALYFAIKKNKEGVYMFLFECINTCASM